LIDRASQRRAYDAKRRQDKPWRAWYKSPAWKVRRRDQLANHPTCHFCEAAGLTRIATVADHNPRHGGDWYQFFCGPLISICKPCHDSIKQSEESLGYSQRVGEDGWPLDELHPANSGVKPRSRQSVASRAAKGLPTAE
jgi:5-methylcytosine-specific restriction enzyme A